jgi:undecaprenyl-diphosphatase
MKNSYEDNTIGKDVKIFQNDNSKKRGMESNNKAIITESIQMNQDFKKDKNSFSNNIKIIIIIIYFAIIIWVETLYRDYLFKKSIPFQEYIQKNEQNKFILKICEIISIFGGELSMLSIFIIIFLFMPLNYSFLILQVVIFSSYLTNTLKMIYQSDRPNWQSEYLTYSCNYGYGNPSGHSLTSISLYLTLSHIIIVYWKIKRTVKILIFILFLLFSYLIIVSRVVLAAHSFNQVLYGFTLGLGLYYILIFIIGYHKYSSVEFLKHIRSKKINYIYYLLHIFLLIFTISVYLIINTKDTTKIEENIFNDVRCKKKNSYAKYKNDGLFQSLSITSLIGAQLGLNILFSILKKQNYMISVSIIEWNNSKIKKNYLLRIPIILLSAIGIILYYIIPKSIPLIFIFIFKSAVPFFLGIFGIHFLGIYMCIYLKIANNEIYKMDVLHEITATA